MGRFFPFLISLLVCIILVSCEKEERGDKQMDGFWYVRTSLEEIYVDGSLIDKSYIFYTRSEILKRYVTFNFQNGNLIVERYDINNKNSNSEESGIIKSSYTYRFDGNFMIVTSEDGEEKTYKYSFVGLSSKSLQLDMVNDLIHGGRPSKFYSKTLLLREIPEDDPTSEEIGDGSGGSTPTEPTS